MVLFYLTFLNKISAIRLEPLANIRQTTRTSRKNEKNLHIWSFYRLSQFIEYKANLEGIKVEYINPAYTSQTCQTVSKGIKQKTIFTSINANFTLIVIESVL